MGTVLMTIKLNPSSAEADLEEIKQNATKVIEQGEGKNPRFEEQPLAFGLKTIVTSFEISEDKEIEPIENALSEIENVGSMQVVDMRRALE